MSSTLLYYPPARVHPDTPYFADAQSTAQRLGVEAAIKRADFGVDIAESCELMQKSRRLVARGRERGA